MIHRRLLPRAFGMLALTLGLATPAVAQTNVTPNLANGVGSFYVDRYAPSFFGIVNGVQGRNDVLQIGVNQSTNLANRAAYAQYTFYNTLGKKTDVNTAGSWLFESDLFVESSWTNQALGYVRSDIWATGTDDANFANPSAYGIVGITNYGGALRSRGWDNASSSWIDFGSAVNLGAWNTFGMAFNAGNSTLSYFVNGQFATSTSALTTTGVANVMYQAYNFNDPALNQINRTGSPDYTVSWSNTPSAVVPEPSTYALMAAGLAGLGIAARRRRRV